MPILVSDHHLEDFDPWFEIFKANPPPEFGRWRVIRGIDDPNRVQVVLEVNAPDVEKVKSFFASEQMRNVIARANEMCTQPIEFHWFEDITPA